MRSRAVIPRERFSPASFPPRSRRDAGHVAALLHTLARRDERTPGSSASGANATTCGPLPPATVIDKTRYSAFAEPELVEHLRQRDADALIVSGSETDVCVLATVLDAIDIGYRESSCATRYAVLLTKGTRYLCGSTTPDLQSR
jgi:hypothetical protein